MNKCPKCGAEFEGKFCPNCGTEWQAEKSCPKCGTKLAGAARFCNNCGYAFYQASASASAAAPAAKRAKRGALVWIKGHKVLVTILSVVLVAALVFAIALPIGLANKDNGIYYAYEFEHLNESKYYKLESGKWTNASGESGTYELDGDKITFYQELFGSNMKLASGTLKDGIITLSIAGAEVQYAKKDAIHIHEYGDWTVITPSTCTEQGVEQRQCSCGETQTRSLPLAEHSFKWEEDDETHWKICSVCGQKFEEGQHAFDAEGYCETCSHTNNGLAYTLREDDDGNPYYELTSAPRGIRELIIPFALGKEKIPVTSIGDFAFQYCSWLTSITIPNSVTSIGDGAFDTCDSLTSITIPDSVTSIGRSAFFYCDSLTSITIPDSVTSIEESTFENCYGLTSVTIPDSVTSIGNLAFCNCNSLTSLKIPDSVTSIGNAAFAYCDSLTSFKIPDSVASIKRETFYLCSGLTSIVIPDSVTWIEECAFEYCEGLTSIVIPDSVTWIGSNAFEFCEELTKITYQGTIDEWQQIDKSVGWDNDTGEYTIYCTDGTIAKDGTVWRR